jgi:Transcription factor subunit Med10 of Mediator complex
MSAPAATSQLEGELVRLLGALDTAAVVVEDFQHGSEPVLAQRLADVASALAAVDDANLHIPLEMSVPEDMVAAVQKGENPDLYALRQLDACVSAKENADGKEEMTGELLSLLRARLAETGGEADGGEAGDS